MSRHICRLLGCYLSFVHLDQSPIGSCGPRAPKQQRTRGTQRPFGRCCCMTIISAHDKWPIPALKTKVEGLNLDLIDPRATLSSRDHRDNSIMIVIRFCYAYTAVLLRVKTLFLEAGQELFSREKPVVITSNHVNILLCNDVLLMTFRVKFFKHMYINQSISILEYF